MRLVQEYASKTRLKDACIALRTRRRAGDGVDGWKRGGHFLWGIAVLSWRRAAEDVQASWGNDTASG